MDKYPEIFVLRHGQTEWNLAGQHQGRLDSPLTAKGRDQAGKQGLILKRLLRDRSDYSTVCSPQRRAQHTAEIALSAINRVALSDDRLCEISFGDWESLTIGEIDDGWPDLVEDAGTDPFSWHFRSPNGENFTDIGERATQFLNGLTGTTVVVTHGITSRVLRGLWLGLDMSGMGALSGGQGCVYHLYDGQQQRHTLDFPKI